MADAPAGSEPGTATDPDTPNPVPGAAAGGVPSDLPGVERLLSLSDGVVAIALTLLVLQLAVPPHGKVVPQTTAGALAKQLGYGADQFVSYIISFYVIAQFWLAHHRVFRHVAGHSEGLAWWNFAFLFTITVMPFSSNLLGEYASNPVAVDIFALNLLLASLATQVVGIFGARRGLLKDSTPGEAMRAGQARALAVVVATSLSMGLAWVNTTLAKYCWLLIALLPWLAGLWLARHDAAVMSRHGAPAPGTDAGTGTGTAGTAGG